MKAKETDDERWLSNLRAGYLAGAEEKLQKLTQATRDLESDPDSAAAYRRLDRLLHNLIGSGGSYGLPEVSDTARVMLRRLKSERSNHGVISPALFVNMWAGIDDLKGVFAQASSSPTVSDLNATP